MLQMPIFEGALPAVAGQLPWRCHSPLPMRRPSQGKQAPSRRLHTWSGKCATLAVAVFWRKRSCRHQLKASSPATVEVATGADVKPAADIAVRSLRWTKGWLDKQEFSDNVYGMLSAREQVAYQELYLKDSLYESTMLVARIQEEEKPKDASTRDSGASPFSFDWGGTANTSRSQVVGCVGCQVKCLTRFSYEEAPQYDGGDRTILAPVMADLAVSSACRGRGIARRIVEQLEDVVRSWGYEQVLLLVEATNFQARGVYARMGYRLCAIQWSCPTSYVEIAEGVPRVASRNTVAFVLRKSLKPFPWGSLENTNWGFPLSILGAAYANTQLSELESLPDLQQLLLASS
eukprot:TRINITY_DN21989_c0_g1_i2.p1 TRINITY_DN21989_c0_g1~~TRINITY_DN21989_c0_g1_i2.p1  ORF type:complete len:347 (-),score=52.92 TRINITY_DN21989_c0_g1_i2:18-1058(-)